MAEKLNHKRIPNGSLIGIPRGAGGPPGNSIGKILDYRDNSGEHMYLVLPLGNSRPKWHLFDELSLDFYLQASTNVAIKKPVGPYPIDSIASLRGGYLYLGEDDIIIKEGLALTGKII